MLALEIGRGAGQQIRHDNYKVQRKPGNVDRTDDLTMNVLYHCRRFPGKISENGNGRDAEDMMAKVIKNNENVCKAPKGGLQNVKIDFH